MEKETHTYQQGFSDVLACVRAYARGAGCRSTAEIARLEKWTGEACPRLRNEDYFSGVVHAMKWLRGEMASPEAEDF